jgi:hypothetical protein
MTVRLAGRAIADEGKATVSGERDTARAVADLDIGEDGVTDVLDNGDVYSSARWRRRSCRCRWRRQGDGRSATSVRTASKTSATAKSAMRRTPISGSEAVATRA